MAGGENRGVLMKISADDQCRDPWIQRPRLHMEFLILSLCCVKQMAHSGFIVQAPRGPETLIMDDFRYCGTREIGGGTGPPFSGDWWWDCPRHCFRVISLVKSGLHFTAILCASPYFQKLTPKVQENGTKWPDGIAAN